MAPTKKRAPRVPSRVQDGESLAWYPASIDIKCRCSCISIACPEMQSLQLQLVHQVRARPTGNSQLNQSFTLSMSLCPIYDSVGLESAPFSEHLTYAWLYVNWTHRQVLLLFLQSLVLLYLDGSSVVDHASCKIWSREDIMELLNAVGCRLKIQDLLINKHLSHSVSLFKYTCLHEF